MTVITEACSCGATFTATTGRSFDARNAASDWRKDHKHAESAGICGDRPPPLRLGSQEIPQPHCVLKAGHAGLHGDGDGAHWSHPTEETRP